MSYSVLLFDPAVRNLVASGRDLDEIQAPPISSAAMSVFLDRLAKYGYEPAATTPNGREFTKTVGSSSVGVLVTEAEISFSAVSEDGIFEALQDASELADRGDLVAFDPQEGDWLEA